MSNNTPIKLRSLSEIPLKYRKIFSQYETFNKVQSKVLDKVLYTDNSIVISAPTGSGKTTIFELAILRLLTRVDELNFDGDFKIVYVAPVKALCTEKFVDWQMKFEPIGIQCLEATGDSEIGDFNCLTSAKLIVTTPEKWDSLTRRWKDAEGVVEAVKLFIIDEVHLVNEDVRGPTLEAIVSRMKTIQLSMNMSEKVKELGLRFVAASATIPNIEDLADWLGEEQSASFFQISESLRPVQLQKHVIGFNTTAQGFRFDMSLNYKLAAIIRKYSCDKPTLIFCSSRKSVEMASKVLAEDPSLISLSDMHKIELQQISRSIQDAKLKQFTTKGIAYHHAGLSYQDRTTIEDAFRKSIILVLVCTNTLAMGVNFPAHLVIIKSTENYVCGKSREYTESAILQMIGRAGRPQFDMNGVAVIMTQQKNVRKYENLMNGCTPIESHLHKHLAEHLNSEIVLQTVTDLSVAMKWIRSTFLYVRAVKCPVNYGFAHGMQREAVEKKLEAFSCTLALVHTAKLTKDITHSNNSEEDISYEDYSEDISPESIDYRNVEEPKTAVPSKIKSPPKQLPKNSNPKEDIKEEPKPSILVKPKLPPKQTATSSNPKEEDPKPTISIKPKLPPQHTATNSNSKDDIENYDEGADFDGDDYFGPSFVGIDSSELGNRGNPRWRGNRPGRGGGRPSSRKPNTQRRRNHPNRRRPTSPRRRLNRRERNSHGPNRGRRSARRRVG